MQDKINEIMGLVDAYSEACFDQALHQREKDDVPERNRQFVESKLRELVREPLDAHEVRCLVETAAYLSTEHQRRADFINGIRYAERAHNITNTSGVE